MTTWYTTKRMEGAGGFSGARDESQGRWGKEPQPEVTGAPGEALSGKHLAYVVLSTLNCCLRRPSQEHTGHCTVAWSTFAFCFH